MSALIPSIKVTGACRVTDEDLQQIRTLRDELIERWNGLPAGEALELRFEV